MSASSVQPGRLHGLEFLFVIRVLVVRLRTSAVFERWKVFERASFVRGEEPCADPDLVSLVARRRVATEKSVSVGLCPRSPWEMSGKRLLGPHQVRSERELQQVDCFLLNVRIRHRRTRYAQPRRRQTEDQCDFVKGDTDELRAAESVRESTRVV